MPRTSRSQAGSDLLILGGTSASVTLSRHFLDVRLSYPLIQELPEQDMISGQEADPPCDSVSYLCHRDNIYSHGGCMTWSASLKFSLV